MKSPPDAAQNCIVCAAPWKDIGKADKLTVINEECWCAQFITQCAGADRMEGSSCATTDIEVAFTSIRAYTQGSPVVPETSLRPTH